VYVLLYERLEGTFTLTADLLTEIGCSSIVSVAKVQVEKGIIRRRHFGPEAGNGQLRFDFAQKVFGKRGWSGRDDGSTATWPSFRGWACPGRGAGHSAKQQ
jgi:hypothetical protein